ncbi:hypothetical protein B0A48_14363 [Cryoendolithus antarcticus]|uniref:Xylanolytic transcriptional activator regulatory domain-containing protein n=1 Tax=Cryoendolithus antarcticus TaxID=1507870 RepID=A0A1V8SJQ0_9PEZI|nr:hypothetical protein B0A48_14363 [Cryoendolithus antarcticus]
MLNFCEESNPAEPLAEVRGDGVSQLLPFTYTFSDATEFEYKVGLEADRTLGTYAGTREVVERFFTGTNLRLPIIARDLFEPDLAEAAQSSRIDTDLSALCIAMKLTQQRPSPEGDVRTSLYISAMQVIGLLEAGDIRSLRVLQTRLLIATYELGHGLSTAAAVSVAACAKVARAMGMRKVNSNTQSSMGNAVLTEERRRVWWAMFNLDRYLGLIQADSLHTMADPMAGDQLPYDDTLWVIGI